VKPSAALPRPGGFTLQRPPDLLKASRTGLRRFTEGFDTADLKDSNMLLDELG